MRYNEVSTGFTSHGVASKADGTEVWKERPKSPSECDRAGLLQG
jgi:hypothetical protein